MPPFLQLRVQTKKIKIQTKPRPTIWKSGPNPDHIFLKSRHEINHDWFVQKVPVEAIFMGYLVNFFEKFGLLTKIWTKSGPVWSKKDGSGPKSGNPNWRHWVWLILLLNIISQWISITFLDQNSAHALVTECSYTEMWRYFSATLPNFALGMP